MVWKRKPRSFHLEVNAAYKRYAEVEVFRRKRRKHAAIREFYLKIDIQFLNIFLKRRLSRHCSSDCLGSVETITALYQSRKTSCTKLVISMTQVQNRSLK